MNNQCKKYDDASLDAYLHALPCHERMAIEIYSRIAAEHRFARFKDKSSNSFAKLQRKIRNEAVIEYSNRHMPCQGESASGVPTSAARDN